MNPTSEGAVTAQQQVIAELRRELAEAQGRLVEALAERDEAVARQIATAEVLRVINSSPGDLVPVFDAILEKAHALCGATHGSLVIRDGEHFRGIAYHDYPQAFIDRLQQGYRIVEHPVSRQLTEGAPFVHTPDIAEIDHPVAAAAAEIGGFRTCLFVPLRREDELLGL